MSKRIAGALLAILTLAAVAPRTAHTQAPSGGGKVDAAKAFERFKALGGKWEGKSTKGWENREQIRVIARGTAIMLTSEFKDADADHGGMATMIHRDGEQLLLTHYCEAGNQPTLAATAAGDNWIEFTFLRGTGMASRDKGHMDRVVYRFVDANHFTSQWTWYSKGKEQWMEEVEYVRTPAQ
jgi:hypothetical protein